MEILESDENRTNSISEEAALTHYTSIQKSVKPELLKKFDHIYIHKDCEQSEVAQRVLSIFPVEKISWVDKPPHSNIKGSLSAEEFSKSKRQIYICNFKGSFFKRCPGARPGLTCCNYFVLNLGLQCDMNCSYCYLQSFINSPVLTIYANIDQALQELEDLAKEGSSDAYRIGTGETIDSLSLDELTLFSRKLIPFFKNLPNWKLELKTKSNKVDQFLDLGPAKNVMTSWSLNPQIIIEKEEHGTASLSQRIQAAKKCLNAGFSLSFHIDPIIWHPLWKESYASLVDILCENFSPEDVPISSMGALRFQAHQKAMMRERFGMSSWVTQAEVFPSKDGKLRYDKDLRQEMFSFIMKRFKEKNPRWNIFLCMETPETWIQAQESMPKNIDGLKEIFDHNLIRKFKSYSENNSAKNPYVEGEKIKWSKH